MKKLFLILLLPLFLSCDNEKYKSPDEYEELNMLLVGEWIQNTHYNDKMYFIFDRYFRISFFILDVEYDKIIHEYEREKRYKLDLEGIYFYENQSPSYLYRIIDNNTIGIRVVSYNGRIEQEEILRRIL